ncbi:MAG: NAD(P)-dependent oxidoreductase [Solirubrobacterales bacterium]
MKIVYLLQHRGIETRTPQGCTAAVFSARADGRYRDEDLRELEDADILVVGLEPVGEEVLRAAPRLKLVQRLGRGYSNVDLEAAERHGVPVCGMPDFNAGTVAEHTMMLILALLRRIFDSTLLMKAGEWPVRTVVGSGVFDLQGKTLGIVGFGAIGQTVAARAAAFDARVRYHDRAGEIEGEGQLGGAHPASWDDLLRDSDIITLHAPLTPGNERLIGLPELERMKRSALLINTARGRLVDEQALADALERGLIAGAGIDVFGREPLDRRHPLRRCPNVLLTPHTAGQTREAMERMVAMMLDNIERVRRGDEPSHRLAPPR